MCLRDQRLTPWVVWMGNYLWFTTFSLHMVTWPHEIHRKRWPRWNFLGVKLRWITQFTPIIPMVKLPEGKSVFFTTIQLKRIAFFLQVCYGSQWYLFDCFDCGTVRQKWPIRRVWSFVALSPPPRDILKPRFVGWFWWIVVAVDNYGGGGFTLFLFVYRHRHSWL